METKGKDASLNQNTQEENKSASNRSRDVANIHNNRKHVVSEKDLEQLNEIGAALTAEKNLDQLLRLTVKKARKILTADAACLYLVDH
ncbi:MAG: hypothetical protein KDD46_05895, partial [Bdellovibrionales bacterium]|nr:hypothetical protein [Bdellovibrionales bacterium]